MKIKKIINQNNILLRLQAGAEYKKGSYEYTLKKTIQQRLGTDGPAEFQTQTSHISILCHNFWQL